MGACALVGISLPGNIAGDPRIDAERLEPFYARAEELGATGIVGVDVTEEQHSWRTDPTNVGNAALQTGEVIELFVIGTAVVPAGRGDPLEPATLVLSANDPIEPSGGKE